MMTLGCVRALRVNLADQRSRTRVSACPLTCAAAKLWQSARFFEGNRSWLEVNAIDSRRGSLRLASPFENGWGGAGWGCGYATA